MKEKSMENEMKNADLSDIMCDLLYLLGCGVNDKMPAKAYIAAFQKAYDADKLQTLYQFSKAHCVDALTGTVLKKAGVKLPAEWEQSIAKAIRKVILFDQERAEIFSYMDEQEIWHMPLKGVILKDFYPSIGMRQMSDNDILFDQAYAGQIRDYMVSRGYEVEAFDQGNHDVYEKEPVYNFEMHTALYGVGHHNEWITYYDRIKDRLHPIENCFEYRFTDEDFYVYIMTHTFKHFDGSGTGIRSLLDQYVYLNRLEDTLDFHYIDKQCGILGIADFEQANRILCKKVFRMNDTLAEEGTGRFRYALSTEEKKLLCYYMTSGAYGTTERRVLNNMSRYRKQDGRISKASYVLKRLFPGKEHYDYCPALKRHHWLLPFYWVYRAFRMILCKERRSRIFHEVKIVKKSGKRGGGCDFISNGR